MFSVLDVLGFQGLDKNGFRLTDELDFGFTECAITVSALVFLRTKDFSTYVFDFGRELVFIGLGSVFLGSGSFGFAGCAFTEPVLDFWISRCAITELVWTFGFIRLRFTSADEPGVPSLNRFGFCFLRTWSFSLFLGFGFLVFLRSWIFVLIGFSSILFLKATPTLHTTQAFERVCSPFTSSRFICLSNAT